MFTQITEMEPTLPTYQYHPALFTALGSGAPSKPLTQAELLLRIIEYVGEHGLAHHDFDMRSAYLDVTDPGLRTVLDLGDGDTDTELFFWDSGQRIHSWPTLIARVHARWVLR